MKQAPIYTALLLISVLLHSCAPSRKIEVTPQQVEEHNAAMVQADELYARGSYLSLKQAFRIYEARIGFPSILQKHKNRYLKTALLLALRQYELGIVDEDYIKKAEVHIMTDPSVRDYALYIRAVKSMIDYSLGMSKTETIGESQLNDYLDWIKDNAAALNEQLSKSAPYEEFFAYLYIAVNEYFTHWIEDKPNYDILKRNFSGSPLIRYKLSIFPEVEQEGLQRLVNEDPEFVEAYQFLGQIELMQGKTLSAEKYFLYAYEKIPRSAAVILSLTRIYFILEEYDRCLDHNEKVLALAPTNRDALLGKAISLSILGRHQEAKGVCRTLLDLGKYYIGEAYYWLGWNDNELKEFDLAWENVEKAKNYLIGHHELHFLAGIIAFEKKDLKRSEEEFQEALGLNPGYCEAHYYIGSIYAKREEWKDSGSSYETSARCSAGQEATIRKKIEEIENSAFDEARKTKHINKRKLQLINIRLSKATAAYNAAASYYNAKMKQKALSMALEASKHPNFKKQSEELIERIRLLD